MLNWIKKQIIELKIRYSVWNRERIFNKEVDVIINEIHVEWSKQEVIQAAVQQAYIEGLTKIKKKVNEKAQIEGHHKVLTSEEVLDLAKGDQYSKDITLMKEVLIYKQEKPQEAMINDRIIQYYELQDYNKERNLIKNIKKARKVGNEKLAKQLEKEWASKYRRSRTVQS